MGARRLRGLRGFARGGRGATALEFALTAPFVVMGLIGICALGYTYYQNDSIKDALRLGARDALLTNAATAPDIKALFVKRLQKEGFGADGLNVSIATSGSSKSARVVYSWSSRLQIPYVGDRLMNGQIAMDLPL